MTFFGQPALKPLLAASTLLAVLWLASPARAAPIEVLPGFDLLETQPGTVFMGVPFEGVPLGTFDFGGGIGTQSVGDTDTIVQRLDTVSVDPAPGDDTIPIELVALHLVSAVPIDLGLGVGFYFVTLQSERGGPASPGQMTVHVADADGGTFDSFFDVFFDIRLGGLDGPIALSDLLNLSSIGTPWGRLPPPGATLIDDANFHLDGSSSAKDFFPIGAITEQHPQGVATHVTTTTTTAVPEPALLGLIGIGLAALGLKRRRLA